MAKTVARGTILRIQTAAGPPIVYTAISNVRNITPPSATIPDINITDMDSTGEETLPGLPDFGTVTFDGLFNGTDAGQTAFRTAAESGTQAVVSWEIDIVPQGKRITFTGWVSSFVPGLAYNDAVTFSASIRATGLPVTTAIP